jgi:hypothetical protein
MWMTLLGSFERQGQPAALWGRGLAGCAVTDADCARLNPSSIASASALRFTLFHSPSPFDLPALSNGGIALTIPLPFGTVQAAATLTGKDLYREQTLAITYGVPLDAAVVVGVSVSYDAVSIARYGSAHTVGVDLGIQFTPMPQLTLGASVLNVNKPTIGVEQDELPRVILIGASYRLSAGTVLSADIVKDIRYPESVRAGIEVRPLSFIVLRTGVSTEPSRFHAGGGVAYRSFEFEYGIATHQELGLTHTFGVSIDF